VIPERDEIDQLICIALLPPEVEFLLDELMSLPGNNPFSMTDELTCDIIESTDPPTNAPSDPTTQEPTIRPSLSPTGSPSNGPTEASTSQPISPAPSQLLSFSLPPTQLLTSGPAPTRSPTTGEVVDATPFIVTYDASGGKAADFAAAETLTCAHLVDVLQSIFDSQFVILERAVCTPVTQSANPIQIGYEVFAIFAKNSVTVPDQSSVDAAVQIALEGPTDGKLITDLQGLPSSNPFSRTTAVTYSVARRRILFETNPESSASGALRLQFILATTMLAFCTLFALAL